MMTLFTNCSKNDDDSAPETSYRLATYTENGIEFNIQYNAQNKPASFETYNISAPGNKISNEVVYNSEGKILSIGTNSYNYNTSGQIANSVSFGRSSTIVYDSQNRPIRVSGSGILSNPYVFQRDYVYSGSRVTSVLETGTVNTSTYHARIDFSYNSQGNIILIESFSGTTPTNLTLQNSTSFTYDTKKNPWYKFFNEDMGNPNMCPICFYDSNKITGDFGQLATNRILYICPNNILTKNTTSYPAGTTNTSNYSYTYNDEDYPITKEVSSSSTTQYFSFTYN